MKAATETETKDMGEGSGTAGGYAVPPEDEPETKADHGFKRHDPVEIHAPHYKGVGRIHSIHAKGLVPDVDETIRGTHDEPAARVKIYKRMGDGHIPTDHHVGVKLKHLSLRDDLEPPSKAKSAAPVKAAAPAAAAKGAKTPEPLPPLVALSEEEQAIRLQKQIEGIPALVKEAVERITGVI